MPKISDTYQIVPHVWLQDGNRVEEKRFLFKDPSNVLLTRQIERWRLPNQIQDGKGLIPGFKLHSVAMHFFCYLLQIISFGIICKSLKIKIADCEMYVNVNSYLSWRRLNGAALKALNLHNTEPNLAQAVRQEISKIAEILAQQLDKRQTAPSICTAIDPFVMVAEALEQARKTVQAYAANTTDIQYQLAAFYILLHGEVKGTCNSQKILQISPNVSAQDRDLISRDAAANPKDADLGKLTFAKFLFDKRSKEQFINKEPDCLSSVTHFNNPVQAKELLTELAKNHKHFYARFAHRILNPLSPKDFPEAEKLYDYILNLGLALQDQFTSVPLTNSIQKLIRETFVEICERTNVITDENRYTLNLDKPICLKVAYTLLTSAHVKQASADQKVLQLHVNDLPDVAITFNVTPLYEDRAMKLPFKPSYLNPLSGKLENEQQLCTNEALEFVEEFTKLSPQHQRHLSLHTEESVHLLLQGKPVTATPLFEKLQKVSELIRLRYWSNYGTLLINALSFENGKIDNLENLDRPLRLKRSESEHRAIINKYFPGYNFILPARRAVPKFNTNDNLSAIRDSNQYIHLLFYSVASKANVGNCLVGALAQAALGHYDLKGKNIAGYEISQQPGIIQQIRDAVANYMNDNPEEFFDLIETAGFDSLDAKKALVGMQAQNMRKHGWFTNAEITAFSSIVGRPVYIYETGPQKIRYNSLEPKMLINDHFDADPIYLLKAGDHVDHLRPKRIGTKTPN